MKQVSRFSHSLKSFQNKKFKSRTSENTLNMKKCAFFSFLFLFTTIGFSQSLEKEVQHPDIAGKLFRNQKNSAAKPLGMPYSRKMFGFATVEKLNINAYMRYNIVNDEFEFITKKNDTLILDKIEDFSTIKFPEMRLKYILTPYVNRGKLVYGYLIDFYDKGDFGLYKKENISFVEAKTAKTSLEINMPAKYSKIGDSYFLKTKETISEFPTNKKGLLKLFPDKKQILEDFVKENKIDFDEVSDQIKIIDYLATH